MPPVFAHGRLRLYLLKLLDEAPRHGYEVIRLLEERFQGLYAPSAGTVYPRLAKLEAEGLVTHTTEGGRKVYAITDAGRAELADRSGELADLELEIRESVAELAAEIRADVRGAAGDLRREMRAAASEARRGAGSPKAADHGDHGTQETHGESGEYGDGEAWRAAKEEMRRVKQEWKEQARRAKDESRRARDEAQRARRQAKEAQENARSQAQEEVQRIARRVQEQVQDHFARGDWPTGVREGLTELAKEFGEFGKDVGREYGRDFGFGRTGGAGGMTDRKTTGRPEHPGAPDHSPAQDRSGTPENFPTPDCSGAPEDFPAAYEPVWAHEDTGGDPTRDPARDLDRLLDRFRDDIRDAARDHGVTADQLREARRHLSTAAARIGLILRAPKT
ncbi:DNA-binding PadR family transcriptional regulator/gas vesicle protein [Streptomyces achromogenes]|uniref:DNA-binding PadR family transcriptional regulator/gas vesicle protein n=1 Tax=Streptomyces achromogenes TaxID=67255 RepID=A0ABU0Q6C0_STRAH|nr:PadR family transcriptional regulator [Streptomyces achromogenes]MDQ0686214.1 DNA-binding PadR family transcriptional regulator/gas vesicle protein [Streptomyces achromogenes]